MKVSSGKFGGRKLADNPYSHIRPTADIVKQSMFNKLYEIIPSSRVLDLFCGTGGLGIEALSRGASEVVFADKDERSLNLTRKNLKNLGVEGTTMRGDYPDTLKKLKGQKFDIILLDPPYMSGVYENALKLIKEFNLLSENGVIVCEHEKSVNINCDAFMLIDQKKYGIKMVSYFKN